MTIYLDNAATTPVDPSVQQAMWPYMGTHYGSPSSIHQHGRVAKVAVENTRKQIAKLLNVSPAEIFFTSGGTEGNNMLLWGSILTAKLRHVITSPLEHQAVLQPLKQLAHMGYIQLHWIAIDHRGCLQHDHLAHLLASYPSALVSVMYANNEIGNLNDLNTIRALCKTHNAPLHTDAVQAIGHYTLDLQALPVHLLVASAHKFHGPKGVGFVYIRNGTHVAPLIYGGAQEQGQRGGTENVAGIVGLGKAMEIAHKHMSKDQKYIQSLKDYMIERLRATIPNITFNGMSHCAEKSLYTILSVSLPPSTQSDLLVFNLDIQGIAASVGSACASGSTVNSHVLQALKVDPKRGNVRFSLSKHNTKAEVDHVVNQLAQLNYV